MEETVDYVAHAFINFPKRKITLRDQEGYEADVRYKFDSDGSHSFAETVDILKEFLDNEDELTFIY
jgi:hypothetical protein